MLAYARQIPMVNQLSFVTQSYKAPLQQPMQAQQKVLVKIKEEGRFR